MITYDQRADASGNLRCAFSDLLDARRIMASDPRLAAALQQVDVAIEAAQAAIDHVDRIEVKEDQG